MIETFLNVIKATAGQELVVAAKLTDASGAPVEELCGLMLHSDNELLANVKGVYMPEAQVWQFTIPSSATTGLSGRYWYCFCFDDVSLCFKQPIYFV